MLTWVSQEQGDVQLIGYVEGAPPCPMANMTNKPGDHVPRADDDLRRRHLHHPSPPRPSLPLKYQNSDDHSDETNMEHRGQSAGIDFGLGSDVCPVRLRASSSDKKVVVPGTCSSAPKLPGPARHRPTAQASATDATPDKLEESNKYTVKMQGTLCALSPATSSWRA